MGSVFIWLAVRSFLCPGETLYVLEKNNSNSILCVIWYLQVILRIWALSAVNKRPPIHNVSGLFQTPHLSRWHPWNGRGQLSPYVAGGSFAPKTTPKMEKQLAHFSSYKNKVWSAPCSCVNFLAFLRSKNETPFLCFALWTDEEKPCRGFVCWKCMNDSKPCMSDCKNKREIKE